MVAASAAASAADSVEASAETSATVTESTIHLSFQCHTLIVRVCTSCSPASSHLDRPRLHTLLARVFTPLARPTVGVLQVACVGTSAMHSRN